MMADASNLIHGSSALTSKLNNYNSWIVRELSKLYNISGNVFEFGCGAGGISSAIARKREVDSVLANDISPDVADFFYKNKNDFDAKITFSNLNIMSNLSSFSINSFDITVSTNTLEHIADEGPVLRRLTLLSRSKKSLILVPAHQSLYGTLDKDGGHYRRYSKKSFTKMVEDNGLYVEKIKYFNLVGAFGWWYQYKFLRITNYQSTSNSLPYNLFDKYVVPIYSPIESIIPIPFGLSLVSLVTA